MKKIMIQGFLALALIAGIWFLFSQVNWMKLFGTEKIKDDLNEKLGELIYKSIDETEKINRDPFLNKTLDSLFYGLCKKNDIDTSGLRIHLVEKDMINAFATPGGHIFVFSGLIKETEKQEELIGVLAHELAHIQLDHVMKKLVTEVGLSALISLTSGTGGAVAAGQVVKLLSSSAYSRSLEKEADIKGVDYMVEAGVKPDGIADFMYKISSQPKENDNLYWIQSHPDSRERAEYLADYSKGKVKDPKGLISDKNWEKFRNSTEKTKEE